MNNLSILPECFVDTNLTETLLQGIGVNHQKGCGTVANRMKTTFNDAFAVGIIDKDKHQLEYLKQFTEVKKTDHLILHKHPQKHHYIIQITPAIEKFIIQSMNDAGLEKADYNLPDDFDKFRKVMKSINSKADPNLKELFGRLVLEEVPQVLLLKRWLTYLNEKVYNVDVAELQKL